MCGGIEIGCYLPPPCITCLVTMVTMTHHSDGFIGTGKATTLHREIEIPSTH